MFELPDAKRVRRADLYASPHSSRSASPEHDSSPEAAELRAKLNARLSALLSLSVTVAPNPTITTTDTTDAAVASDPAKDDKDAGEAEFAFRLFSTATTTTTTGTADAVPKVVLAPDDVDVDSRPYSGPALSQRPVSHYLRGELTPRERAQFEASAVAGQEVLAWAGRRAWGLEVPWRLTRVVLAVGGNGRGRVRGGGVEGKLQQQQSEGGLGEGMGKEEKEKKKKKRPGKKSRIVLRKREKARREIEAAVQKRQMSKEEHLKEKKKRLNHLKKLKRRQKEKEKKLAARGEAGGEGQQDAAGSAEEGSSDGDE
ncbi:hypothetical protein N658DRAFT_556959 [Parathielavia hyrcaniae]|uniref:Uncharacterized protein n=1 Tax=Parathielavia hyrcaniae TaxID=113614 RepID=A0AAN6Q901_9PEZI|nr:hypothetical protein N658DRAFT_556959 [Parathielavia hyrcaniae]